MNFPHRVPSLRLFSTFLRIALLFSVAACCLTFAVNRSAASRQQTEPAATLSRIAIANESAAAFAWQESDSQDLKKVFRREEIIELDAPQTLNQIRQDGEMSLVVDGQTLQIALTPNDLRAANYKAVEVQPNGVRRTVEPAPLGTFKGTVRGKDHTEARFTLDGKTIEGLIIIDGEKHFIEPLNRYSKTANSRQLISYKESDVIDDAPLACAVPMEKKVKRAAEGVAAQVSTSLVAVPQSSAAVSLNRDIEIATEADYEYVSGFNGSADANNEILNVMNLVDGVYENDLGISFTVVYQHTWNTPSDPFTTTNPASLLTEFQTYWNNNLTSVNRDVAHLWTGKILDGNIIGTAFLNSICRTPARAYGLSVRAYDVDTKLVAAHELGHNLGATHPDEETPPVNECANSIMGSHLGYSRSFCQFSLNQITSYVNSNASCLEQTFTISGQINNTDGYYRVPLTISGPREKTVQTDLVTGNYLVRGLVAGTYTITPSTDFHVYNPPSQTLNVNSDLTGINFIGTLVTYSISGRITDSNNNPLSGIPLTLQDNVSNILASTATDANGDYIFPAVPATRDYRVQPYVQNARFTPSVQIISNLRSNQTGINFTGILPTPTPTPTPTPVPVPITGLTGKIVYTGSAQSNYDIFVMDADGSNQINLTNDSVFDETPDWSPDGSKIAFKRAGYIHIMNADGSGLHRLTNNQFLESAPAWSPDGTKVLFNATDKIYLTNADGSNQIMLPVTVGYTPRWSPDGTKILFADGIALSASRIWVMNADGSGQTPLTAAGSSCVSPKWSPDGTKIVFLKDGAFSRIYVMNPSGGNLTQLSEADLHQSPAWSPDGTKIIYSLRGSIYVMNANGSSATKITNDSRFNSQPAWKSATPPSNVAPTLLTEENSNQAIALDSVTRVRGPFALFNPNNFSSDQRTRITLFALDLGLRPYENASAITAQAEDSQHRIYTVSVEQAGQVTAFDWLNQIVIKLPDELAATGDVSVSLTLHGMTSNKVIIKIK